MTKMKLLAAAAVLSSVIATPVLAQDSMYRRGPVTQEYSYDNGYRDGGFWPGEVAAGIVGGAIGTAGAIAAAPFQDGYVPRDSYAQANGFVCQPGTWFRGEDGRRHICQ